jgi:DNA-binding XRE family transcriptional regulator
MADRSGIGRTGGLCSKAGVQAKWLRILICAVPFCRQTPLTLKALRSKDYSQEPSSLGEHLKKRRRELGLLQRDAATRMGGSTATVVLWETNRARPVAAQFRPLVEFLDYDPTPEPQTLGERLEAKQRSLD